MAKNKPGQAPKLQEDARLASLEERLRKAQADEAARIGKKQTGVDKNYRLGNRVLGELIGAPAGGALIGWLFDSWLGTSPWLLLAMLFTGIGVAFRNIIRLSNERAE
jgi:ATP synthase protein I